MKIAVFSDIHGNLEVLEAILEDISKNDYDEVICLGDMVNIGPSSLECLRKILDSNVRLILGNHDLYFIHGIDKFDIEEWKIDHYKYVYNTLPDSMKEELLSKDLYYRLDYNNHSFLFTHYFLKDVDAYYPYYGIGTIKRMKVKQLLTCFDTEYIIYGHDHSSSHYLFNKRHLIDVGSSGCVKDDKTFYTEIIIDDEVVVNTKYVKYDRDKLVEKLLKAKYPMIEHYREGFFGVNDLH